MLWFGWLIIYFFYVLSAWSERTKESRKNEVSSRSWNLLFHFQTIGVILKDIVQLFFKFQTRQCWLTVFSGQRTGGFATNYELWIMNYEWCMIFGLNWDVSSGDSRQCIYANLINITCPYRTQNCSWIFTQGVAQGWIKYGFQPKYHPFLLF